MIKKNQKFLSIVLIFFISFFSIICNISPLKTSAIEPINNSIKLTLYPSEINGMPNRFRKTSTNLDVTKSANISLTGLKDLNISGSQQFSEFNLPLIIKSIGVLPITVVDLREESHGFINGLPVSFENTTNNANKGLTREQVISKEKTDLATIKIGETLNLNGKQIAVKDVKTENDVTNENKVSYLRIPVTDRELPTADMVDFFIDSVIKAPTNSWFHFHCKHGIGRTTTFMVMYDMMKNSKNVSMNDIIQRQLLLANFNPKDTNPFKEPEKLKFLENFYGYTKASDNFKIKWSDWKNSNKISNTSLFKCENLMNHKNNLSCLYENNFVNTNENIINTNHSRNPILPTNLYVISQNSMTHNECTMIATLQGLISTKTSTQIYTLNSSQPDYKIWLYDLKSKYNIRYEIVDSPWKLINIFKNYIDGYILYNTSSNKPNASINNACSLASLKNSIVIDESIENKVKELGINKTYDCRNTDKAWAFNNLWNKGLNHSTVIQLSPDKDTSLRDYAIMTKSLVFYEDTINDTSLRDKIFSYMDMNGTVLGWGPDEFINVSTASKYGVSVVAADWAYNLSVLSAFPLKKLSQPKSTVPNEKSAHYVTFIMSDGDNVQWCLGNNFSSTKWFGSSYKENFNLGWSLSPALYYLSPTVFDMYYKADDKSKNKDYFVVSPSGNGYMYPSKFKKENLEPYVETLNSYMKMVDQKYVTIIDDGAFYNRPLWKRFLSKSNIDGLFYLDYHRHDAYDGKIIWVNEKPIVSCRDLLWSNLEDEENLIATINNRVNLGQVDIHSANSYTFVYVHVWSKDISNVNSVINKLDPKVKVVTPDVFMRLIKQNLSH